MTGITAAGTGSGIDIESLVTKLMSAEQTPLTALSTKASKIQTKISLIGQFKSLVSSLQTSAESLQNLGNLSGIKATLGNSSALSVTTANSAATANYSVDVLQLARAQQVVSTSGTFTSAGEALVANGSGAATAKITLNFGTVSGSSFSADVTRVKTISIEAGTDGEITLQDVADAINGGDYGVSASLISDKSGSVRLSLTGDETGAENAFSLGVSYLDSGGAEITPSTTQNLSKLAFDPSQTSSTFAIPTNGSAQDAKMKLNGVEIVRASNTIDDAVDGLTFNLTGTTLDSEGTSTATTLTVARNSTAITTQLQAFVTSYNNLAKAISSTTSYNATTKTAGTLQGDSTIRGMQTQLRSLMTQTFGDGSNSTKTLSSLGIAFQKDGTLALDSSKLSTAVEDDLDGVLEFLGAFDQKVSSLAPEASKDGFAYKLAQLTKGMVADDGLFDAKLDGLNKSVDNITDQKERLNTRLVAIEKRYRAQFTAMDTAIANMQTLSSYVSQLVASTSSSSS